MAAGVFTVEVVKGDDLPNIRPMADIDAIPEDQAKLQAEIYNTYRVLKSVETWRPLLPSRTKDETEAKAVFKSFRDRLLQVAECGLVGAKAKTAHASSALEQVREEIGIRMGRRLKFRYLGALAIWALLGACAGVVLNVVTTWMPDVQGYGWVVIGSMAGAWVSAASTRRTIDLKELPGLLGRTVEPLVRLLYVALIAGIVAILLQREVITIKLGNADLKTFTTDIGMALLLGVVCGIAERTLSARVIKLAGDSASTP